MKRAVHWPKTLIPLGAIILTGVAVSIIFAFIQTNLPYKYKITTNYRSGGFGGYPVLGYDANGNLCDIDLYTGKAPLYLVKHEFYSQLGIEENLPNYLAPTLLKQFSTVYYPFVLSLETTNEWLRQGESTAITTTMEITDDFAYRDGRISVDQAIKPLFFNLEAPNFEFQPQNSEILPKDLLSQNPIHQVWVIAPKDRTIGQQVIFVSIKTKEDYGIAGERYELNVWPISGFNPYLIGVIVSLGLFFGWIVKNYKDLLEIRLLLQKSTRGS